ncbi:MAG: hypothetical protein IK955_10690 [Clostridia bacterium]|nr:hypothetical protein [Clostridia bacterium]
MDNSQKKVCIQALVLITTPRQADRAADMFVRRGLDMHYRFNGQGTAPNEIVDMLGLGGVDKSIMVSVLPKELSGIMLESFRTELQMHAVNSGIAFTIPLNGISNILLRVLAQSAEKNGTSLYGKDESGMADNRHTLVVAVVNRGFSGEVMDAAKRAGARGGTIVHSRHTGDEEKTGFWGLGIQEEKEIVMILTEVDKKVGIMKSVGERCGAHSDAKGIVISLPVDAVAGI